MYFNLSPRKGTFVFRHLTTASKYGTACEAFGFIVKVEKHKNSTTVYVS